MGDRTLKWKKVGENIEIQINCNNLCDLREGDVVRVRGLTTKGHWVDFEMPLHWAPKWPNEVFWLDGLLELDNAPYKGWYRVQLEIDLLHLERSSLCLKPDSRPAIRKEDFLDVPALIPALK